MYVCGDCDVQVVLYNIHYRGATKVIWAWVLISYLLFLYLVLGVVYIFDWTCDSDVQVRTLEAGELDTRILQV